MRNIHPSGLRPFAVTLVLSLVALVVNLWAVPVLGEASPTMSLGRALAMLVFLWYGPIYGSLAVVISSIPGAIAAADASAVFVVFTTYCLEGIVVTRWRSRIGSLVVADALYWCTIGAVADVALYGGIGGFGRGYLAILLLKQLLNGAVNAIIAELLAKWRTGRRIAGIGAPEPTPLSRLLVERTMLAVTLPLSVIGLMVARNAFGARESRTDGHLQGLTRRAGIEVERLAGARLAHLHRLAEQIAVSHAVGASASVDSLLDRAVREAQPMLLGASVTDRDGHPISGTSNVVLAGGSDASPAVREALQSGYAVFGPLQRTVMASATPGRPRLVLPIAVPMVDARGRVQGVLTGAVDADGLAEHARLRVMGHARNAKPGENESSESLTILDRDGLVVLSTDTAVHFGERRKMPILGIRRLAEGRAVVYRSGQARVGRGIRVALSEQLPTSKWWVVAEEPVEALQLAIVPTALAVVMAVFGLIMLLFLAVRTLAQQLLRPLQAIDALSADLADERPVSAERFEPLHESRAVEIRSLAGRLSRMDLAVRERRANDVARANESEERFQDTYRQLLQSQKMEGLGQLAGGVAHDFNNMLAGILGSAELLGIELPPESDAHAHVGVILNSGRRAAALTRQLLTFARAQRTTAERLNVHDVLQNALDLVSRTFDRRIEVRQLLHAQRTTVFGDATLLQNVLMNLAVNARDAMPEGGTLTITTRDATLDEEFSRQHSFPVAPGEFVEIIVSDTGHGMSPEVRDRIFEPFYTTKPVGRGTGLGLAVVYGTVRDHHGAIAVCSELGVGTEFRLYLPVDAGVIDATAASQTAVPGSGCVLVVDDEPLLRQTARRVLESLGYDVLLATDGEHALQVFRAERARIDLVLLDLVMPKMDGQATFHALRTLSPGLRIVLCSGFSADSSWTSLLAYPNVAFVEKPYQRAELSVALAGGLEASSAER